MLNDLSSKAIYQTQGVFNTDKLPEFKEFVAMEKSGVKEFFEQLQGITNGLGQQQKNENKLKP